MQKILFNDCSKAKLKKPIIYSNLHEAIEALKKTATANFIESVELHANLNIDPKYTDQQLRAVVTLPYGTGKKKTIAILTNKENFEEAKIAGADIIGHDDLIQNIIQGNINFDLLIATPNMMPKLAKIGRILGPRGLMPSVKSGTVSNDLKSTLKDFKDGKIEYKTDKTGVVHINFGKIDFSTTQLIINLKSLYNSIEKNRPSGVKGKYFKTIFLCTTMGPSIKLDLKAFN